MANIGGPAIIGAQDLYSSSSTKGASLGQRVYGPNGKEYRYALYGETGVVGDIYQSSVVDTQFDSLTPYAAATAGDTIVYLTNGTTAVTANQFVDGTLSVSVTPGLGDEYTIVSHSTAANGAVWTLTLDRPIRTGWTVAATKVTARRSPYSGVIKCPTSLTGTVVGVGLYAVTSGEYGWLQTKGVAGVLSDNSTGAIGSDVGVPGATAGSVGVNVAGTGKCNTVGRAMRALSTGLVVPIDLCI